MEVALTALQPACVLCNAPATSTDHVRALSRGHGLYPGNAVRLCLSCNSKKHNKRLADLPAETRDKLIDAADAFYLHWLAHTN